MKTTFLVAASFVAAACLIPFASASPPELNDEFEVWYPAPWVEPSGSETCRGPSAGYTVTHPIRTWPEDLPIAEDQPDDRELEALCVYEEVVLGSGEWSATVQVCPFASCTVDHTQHIYKFCGAPLVNSQNSQHDRTVGVDVCLDQDDPPCVCYTIENNQHAPGYYNDQLWLSCQYSLNDPQYGPENCDTRIPGDLWPPLP